VRKNYPKLKDIFIIVCSQAHYPNISLIEFGEFAENCHIIDNKIITMSTIDRLFIATNYEVEDNDENPNRALNRFEFIEILIRIANTLYRETGHASTYADALDLLLSNNIFPKYDDTHWQSFRDKELWTQDVNDILEANLGLLL